MRVNQSGNNQVASTETSGTQKTGKAKDKKQAEAQKKTGEGGHPSAVKTDLSARGREMAKAKAVANETPDVRDERIAELKRRIAEKKYNVSAEAVADKMVDEHINMSGIG